MKVPPDMKGSAAMAALDAEKANPQADCAYYSGGIGFQAALKGLHQPYQPAGFDAIPAALKDPEGKWFTVHTGHIAFLVNTAALRGKPVPRSFADLLKPDYKGLVVYDDPTIQGTGFTFVYGVNTVLGGGATNSAQGTIVLTDSWPSSSTSWLVWMKNNGTTSATFTPYAICGS